MNNLKPCPFCGKEMFYEDDDTIYPSGTYWYETEDGLRAYGSIGKKHLDIPREQWCYNIICQEHYGGCGATVYGDTEQETIDKWNQRK